MTTMLEDTLPAQEHRNDRVCTGSNRRRPSLLLLEDDPDISEVLAHWTRAQGLQPVHASTVSEAGQLISDIELVGADFRGFLADYRLPDATSVRAIEGFRLAFPGRPVALVTAYHDLPVAIWAKARGIPIFLKPIDRRLLASWLRAVAASA